MKQLIVGADPFPPYQYISKEGKIKGSDYETIKSIMEQLGYDCQYIIKDWPLIEKEFNEGKIDIVYQVQKTPEREKNWYFSSKLRDAVTSIITSLDEVDFTHMDELFKTNEKLAVIENYQYGDPIDNIHRDNKIEFSSLEELLKHVNKGEVAFGVVDLGVYNYINQDNVYKHIKVITKLNFNRPLYVAFNSSILRDEFNKIMYN